MHISHDDRRTDRRVDLERVVKVHEPRGGRYMPARTLNASAGGMLLALRGGGVLPAGTPIAVAVDWSGVGKLLGRRHMLPATVVRRVGVNGAETYAAIQFSARQPHALAA